MLRSSLKPVLVMLLFACSAALAGTPQTIYSFTSTPDGRYPIGGVVRTADGSLYGTTYYGGTYDLGTVYKISPSGQESILHSFAGGADGAKPAAALFLGQQGELYGTTEYGGTGTCTSSQGNGCGTVFQVDPGGSVSILYSFKGGSDGYIPNAGVIQVANGDLYGTTNAGGAYNSGTVFHLTLNGVETLLHTFNYSVEGAFPGGLVEGNDGNFYATYGSYLGGVFRITPDGVLTMLHAFGGGPNDAAFPTGSLTQDDAGNFYGTAPYGGEYGLGAIFSITPTGQESLVYSFSGGSDGERPNSALLLEGGALYGITPQGGNNGYGTIFSVTLAGVESSLYAYPDCEDDNTQQGVGIAMIDSGQAGVAYGVTSGGCPGITSDLGSVYRIDLTASGPTAVAGANQTIAAGQTVYLNGSGSYAPDTTSTSLGYAWSFVSTPSGSSATLSGATTATPSFLADQPGTYVAQLVVTDPLSGLSSAAAQVIISSVWSPPTANAGPAQSSVVGVPLTLSGSGTDPNGLPLTYTWSLVAAPSGSAAALVGANSPMASFSPDVAGSYTVGLVVSDEFGSSSQSTVTVSVITASDYAQQQIGSAINYMATVPDANLDAPGHREAFTNLLDQAITAIQAGDFLHASEALTNAITRTDGCVMRGTPDGPGTSMDWVTNCVAQPVFYTDLTNALNILP